jgi:hypothetical protein
MKKLIFLLILLPAASFGMRYINLNDGMHAFGMKTKICFTQQLELSDRNKPAGLGFFLKPPPEVWYGYFTFSLYMNNKELIYPTEAAIAMLDTGYLIFKNIDLTQQGLRRIAGQFNILLLHNITFCLQNAGRSDLRIEGAAWYNVHPV